MEDDWDDGATKDSVPSNHGVAVALEGGRKFALGRGFGVVQAHVDDGWGSNVADNTEFSNDDWNTDDQRNFQNKRGGTRFTEESRRTGRGGRGGREGSNRNDGGWGDFRNYNGENRGDSDRRGRGNRGGGRGRGGGSGSGFGTSDHNLGYNADEKNQEKPREIYVPVERTTDEELFTSTITSGINFVKLDEIEVNVTGEDVPPPIASFESSGLRQHLLDNVKKSGYTKPTPIQKHAIPIIMNGRDLMGCAQTGSGKTAAFLLPIIHQLMVSQDPPITDGGCQPRVIIVSPTRELAMQIYEQAKKFAYNSIVKTEVAYGGTSVLHQKNRISSGCHILVATPGRLNDFVRRRYVSFASLQFFVLDEADRMLDMGFLPTVEEMMCESSMVTTGERQTLMFSATFPEEIQHLAGKFLHNYIFIAVGIVGSASTDVQQIFHQVTKFEKRERLLELLREDNCRTMVFIETKRNADFIATYISENDIKTTSIHGDRRQQEREDALWDFKKGICRTLVATGVAARGLDIEGIQHVINYDLPKSIDEYVHRIGRTGRVGNRGKATSFFDPDCDRALAGDLAKILKQAGQEVPTWLASGDFSYAQNDTFGGTDIRGGDFGRAQNFNTQPAEEPEEEW